MTHFDLRWPSSISPSTSSTLETRTTSPLSPLTEMVVSSLLNHFWPQSPTFFVFQCQLAVEDGIAMAAVCKWDDMKSKRGKEKNEGQVRYVINRNGCGSLLDVFKWIQNILHFFGKANLLLLVRYSDASNILVSFSYILLYYFYWKYKIVAFV